MSKLTGKLGKYRLSGRLCEGSFASVYAAVDTIEGVSVALKIPHPKLMDEEALQSFKQEARICAKLDHPNILPIKNAQFIDDLFVIVYPLGQKSLADRMQHRMSVQLALDFAEQIMEGVAHAHDSRVIHCDVKPDNFILFPHNRLRLIDFGISKIAMRTLKASGSGTIGYIAPEQAFGKPSFRSDVFSIGLIVWQLVTSRLPEWPFAWPPPGIDRAKRKIPPELIAFLRRAMQVTPRRRFAHAGDMLAAFRGLKPRIKSFLGGKRRKRKQVGSTAGANHHGDWRNIRRRQLLSRYGRLLALEHECPACQAPMSQFMRFCPGCGRPPKRLREQSSFPASCPSCGRGCKLDWRYCAHCYGPGFSDASERSYSDRRYTDRCRHPDCRGKLMPFMHYCPWCHRKVQQRWRIGAATDRCGKCGWGVLPEFWQRCPWCSARLQPRGKRRG